MRIGLERYGWTFSLTGEDAKAFRREVFQSPSPLGIYSDYYAARHIKSSAGQKSLWGPDEEELHPRAEKGTEHGGEFVKKDAATHLAHHHDELTPAVESKQSQESKPEAGQYDDELREDMGVSREKLDTYDPEYAVKKIGKKWTYVTLQGSEHPTMADTRKEAVAAATRHKQLKEDQHEHPAQYRDIVSVRAEKRIKRAEALMSQGKSEWDAYAQDQREIPDPVSAKPNRRKRERES